MALRVAALFLLLSTPAVYAVQHVVGGPGGSWSTAGGYSTWAAGETFNVGDTLLFNYDTSHGVIEVSKDDYDNCNTGNALQSYTGGKSSVTLSKPGSMYFICPILGHCGQGMQLAVNVQGSSSPPSSSTPTTPSTPSGSTAPSTSPTTSSPSAKSSPSGSNGAVSGLDSLNHLMLGLSLVLGALFVRV
ncbi:mavicyanin [Coffea arabica]|uniref:Mavicyanin n=1 Tax=Coffea arabica TaxID=13443 RepID=A0A6P6WI36_COFAR|nr:mavicyanin-like [Coffea arabica]